MSGDTVQRLDLADDTRNGLAVPATSSLIEAEQRTLTETNVIDEPKALNSNNNDSEKGKKRKGVGESSSETKSKKVRSHSVRSPGYEQNSEHSPNTGPQTRVKESIVV